MHYVTHQFAHLDSLDRARRWLVQLGFDPGQIEVHTDGIPRIALMVHPGQQAEAEFVINAAELDDPEGWPSFWDLARQEHVYPAAIESVEFADPHRKQSSVIGWHPADQASSTEVATPGSSD